jgi:hypothetical protein
MAVDALWRVAIGVLRRSWKPTQIHMELMSNEDLDDWLNGHGGDWSASA